MLDWLVVGGGVHGTHISHVLTQQLGVPRHRLRVVDPHPASLHLWAQRTATVGMRFMRSPMVHHLDVHPFSLKHFASSAPIANWARFAYPFKRPSLPLFNAHSQRVVESFGLD
ncbi:MAG: FAD/NAD(P)-binding protein, partial [Bacteroidota bacterium]